MLTAGEGHGGLLQEERLRSAAFMYGRHLQQ